MAFWNRQAVPTETPDAAYARRMLVGRSVYRFASDEEWKIVDLLGIYDLPNVVTVTLKEVVQGETWRARCVSVDFWMSEFDGDNEEPARRIACALDRYLRACERSAWEEAHAAVAMAHAHSRWIAA